MIPLETFFNIDYPSLHQQGGHGASIFYAQSWALMHYLIQGNNGKRKAQLGVFMELLATGAAVPNAFRQAFGADYAAMENELRTYVAQKVLSAPL